MIANNRRREFGTPSCHINTEVGNPKGQSLRKCQACTDGITSRHISRRPGRDRSWRTSDHHLASGPDVVVDGGPGSVILSSAMAGVQVERPQQQREEDCGNCRGHPLRHRSRRSIRGTVALARAHQAPQDDSRGCCGHLRQSCHADAGEGIRAPRGASRRRSGGDLSLGMLGRPWVPLGADLILDGQPCWLLYSIITMERCWRCFIVFIFLFSNDSDDLWNVRIFLILSGV